MRLANKIGLFFFVTAIILTCASETFFYMVARDSLKTAIMNNLATVVTSRARHVETYLKMMEMLVVQRSKSVVFENFLVSRGQTDPARAAAEAEALASAVKLLTRTVEASPVMQECFLLDAAGRVAASSKEKSVGEDRSADPYFINARQGVYIKDAYRSHVQAMPAMAVSAPLVNTRTGAFLGVFVARLSLNELGVIINDQTGLGKTGTIIIANQRDEMVVSSRFGENSFLVEMKGIINEQKNGPLTNDRGQRVLAARARIPSMGWTVIAESGVEEAFAPLLRLFDVFLVILLLVPALAAWVGWAAARKITAPLARLQEGMTIIGKGRLDYRVGTDETDEIGQLSRAFDRMSDNLKKTTVLAETLNVEIGERNKMEIELRASEGRFLDVLHASHEPTLLIGETRFMDCNEAVVQLLGYASRAEVLKAHPSQLSPPVQSDGQSSFEKANEMMRLATEKGQHQFEWVHCKANGVDLPVRVTLTAIAISGKTVLHCVWEDLSRIKQDERLVTEQRERLTVQAQELDAALAASRRSQEILSSMLEDNSQIREQVEHSARRMKLILESSGEGILGLDMEGRHTFINPQALRMLGYKEEELLGKESHPLWHHSRPHGSAYPNNECPHYKVLHGAAAIFGEEYFWRKDGSGFPVEFNAQPQIEEGKTVGLVVTFRDITQRKQAVDALRQSEEKIRSVTDSAQDAIVMMDPKGCISFWNPAAERIFGYSTKEALGQNLHRFLVPKRFHPAHDGAFPEFLRTGQGAAVGKTLELAAIRKDGIEIAVDLSLSASRRTDGWHAVGIMHDITERKLVAERLNTLTRAIEQSPSSIMITDTQGVIEYVNPHFLVLTGYTVEEVVGRKPGMLKSGETTTEEYQRLWEMINGGHVWRGEFHNKKKNGELFWEEASITPVRNAQGETTHFVAVKEDITERKVAEEAMKAMRSSLDSSQAQLFQTSKLATLGEMSTGLAHEINQPLNGIALVSTMLRKYVEKKILTDDKVAAGVRDIDLCVQRMTKIINHIRAFARQEEMTPDEMDLTETINSALGLLGAQLREHQIEVETVFESGLPRIHGEPFQLEQVWINAMSNARDSMNTKQKMIADGELAVEGYRKKLVVQVTCDQTLSQVVVAVTDNGMGITEEHKKKAFDPFFTTKEVGKGTGLGLSISYGIIESHKGVIELGGKPGEGATLTVRLPFSRAA